MKKDLNYYYKHAITINEFLESFYGENSFKDRKFIHENIKTLFPDIERVDFEDIVKNPELVYTGKVVLVKDANNNCIPYVVEKKIEISLDDREKLITELVSAISKFISNCDKSLILLENSDSISNNIIGSTNQDINIIDEEIVKLNNDGGIFINNSMDIYTFQYLVFKYLESICYSKNYSNALDLSKEKDFISINITTSGRVYMTKNGNSFELLNLLDIKNFLLKSYYPKQEELNNNLNSIELDLLMDYELERLLKKYKKEKNGEMYFKVKKELNKRYKEHKRDNKVYLKAKRKMNLEEE